VNARRSLSHAASFALLVYVSAWLKHYYPAAFAAALLNSQPMGFYAPAQLVRNAREHGVALADDPDRRYGDRVEITVGDHKRDFDDPVGLGLQPGHLHVDPDQAACVLGHCEFA
jgi:error-prone DNA polymerase